jgi:hypothetical protein
MTKATSSIQVLLGLAVWATIGVAEGGVIRPVIEATGLPDPNATVSATIFDQNGRDVTDTWVPTWSPPDRVTPVYVAFNAGGAPVTPSTVTLVPPVLPVVINGTTNPALASLSTSAYPGRCTNFSSVPEPADPSDYTFSSTGVAIPNNPNRIGFLLTPQDCGGIAVLRATINGASRVFVLPQDSNRNGIPDIWEAQFCPNNTCPTGLEDNDTGPVAGSPVGDGIAALDEYRGFIVSGRHASGDPRQRDVFVHLANAQCTTATVPVSAALLGGGSKTYPTDNSSLFESLLSLVPGSQVHVLGYVPGQLNSTTDEWVDRFVSFTQSGGFQYLSATGALTTVAPVDDRRINKNAIFPLGLPSTTGTPIQKGLRITECLDTAATAPLGTTGIGTTNGPDNSLVYTRRIVNYLTGLINASTKPLKLLVFENGTWVSKVPPSGVVDADFVISQAMKFYVAHELTHSTRLTPTIEGTSRTSYGYHHAPGTGSVMDQQIVQKIEKTTNSFYIPSVYNGADRGSYKIVD